MRLVVLIGFLAACGGTPSVSDMGAADMTVPFLNGCTTYPKPVAQPGEAPDGDTYAEFARGFFDAYCIVCHATTKTGADRGGAPVGYDWDVEATIRAHLPEIRSAVGVTNYMPAAAPLPTCDERRRLVRWIDLGAP
jgi:uncharacterized membrane protein